MIELRIPGERHTNTTSGLQIKHLYPQVLVLIFLSSDGDKLLKEDHHCPRDTRYTQDKIAQFFWEINIFFKQLAGVKML